MEGTITDILPQQRRPGKRFNVFLNHRYAFSVHADLAGALRVGQTLSAPEVDELLGRDQLQRAVDAALIFLSYRPRSEHEVRQRLDETYAPEMVEAALQKLRDWRVLDDADFARYWVQQRRTFRPRGARMLEMELRRKGVDSELAAEASSPDEDESALAYKAGQKKASSLKGSDFTQFRQRLGAFLARRGFDWETVNTVVRRLWNEQQEAPN